MWFFARTVIHRVNQQFHNIGCSLELAMFVIKFADKHTVWCSFQSTIVLPPCVHCVNVVGLVP